MNNINALIATAAKAGFEQYGSFNEEEGQHDILTCLKGKYSGEVIDIYSDWQSGNVNRIEYSTQFKGQEPTFKFKDAEILSCFLQFRTADQPDTVNGSGIGGRRKKTTRIMDSLQQILKKVITLQALHEHGLKEATMLRNVIEGEVKTSPKITRKVSKAVMGRNLRLNKTA